MIIAGFVKPLSKFCNPAVLTVSDSGVVDMHLNCNEIVKEEELMAEIPFEHYLHGALFLYPMESSILLLPRHPVLRSKD